MDPYRSPTSYVDPFDFERMRKRMDHYERVHDYNVRRMSKWYVRVCALTALAATTLVLAIVTAVLTW